MEQIIELSCGKDVVRVEVKSKYWCELFLIKNNQRIFLGGDSINIIKERVAEKIETIQNLEYSNFMIENNKVCWLISLLETFTSIFITKTNPTLVYFLYKDKSIDDYDKIELTQEELKQWINKINNIKELIQ